MRQVVDERLVWDNNGGITNLYFPQVIKKIAKDELKFR